MMNVHPHPILPGTGRWIAAGETEGGCWRLNCHKRLMEQADSFLRVTGPPWVVAGKSTDALTSGGDHVCRTRIRPETAPIGLLIASGIF
jgi:hypothetical protein